MEGWLCECLFGSMALGLGFMDGWVDSFLPLLPYSELVLIHIIYNEHHTHAFNDLNIRCIG